MSLFNLDSQYEPADDTDTLGDLFDLDSPYEPDFPTEDENDEFAYIEDYG